MRSPVLLIAVLMNMFAVGLCQQPSIRNGEARFPWPGAGGLAQANALDKGLIAELVQSLQEDQYVKVGIGEFQFVVLERGKVHLVATTDYSGRSFFYYLSVVTPLGAGKFAYTGVPSHGPHVLGRELVDLNGDGTRELLVKELAGGYEGADTVLLYWISVRKMIDGELQDQSAQFADFYRNEYVPMLNALDRAASCTEGCADASCKTTALAEFLRLKMEREAFSRPKAGLEKALAWSEASQLHLQILAVRTLAEIDDPRAESALERLAQSGSQTVALRAQKALQAKRPDR